MIQEEKLEGQEEKQFESLALILIIQLAIIEANFYLLPLLWCRLPILPD